MATIEEYIEVNNRVNVGVCESNRARWEFGKMMLAECGHEDGKAGRPGLPKARMEELVKGTGLYRDELAQRMRFAKEIRTEKDFFEISNKSWEQIKRGFVKPRGGQRKPSDKPPKHHDRHDEVVTLHEQGKTVTEIEEITGLGRNVRHIIERENIEQAAKEEVKVDVGQVDWKTVPGTAKQKIEAFRRKDAKQLEAEFEPRVQAAVQVRIADAQAHMDKLYNQYRAVLGIRKGIFTKAEYDLIRKCLHPDRRLGTSDEELANAFRLFNEQDIVLLNEANRPTEVFSLNDLFKPRKPKR